MKREIRKYFILAPWALLVGLTFKALETRWQVCTQEDLLSKEDQVWKCLNKQILLVHGTSWDAFQQSSAEGAHLCPCETTLNCPIKVMVMGKVSKAWNKANFTPACKNDKKKDPGSYRPVSFTSVLAKVIKQIILETVSSTFRAGKSLEVMTISL